MSEGDRERGLFEQPIEGDERDQLDLLRRMLRDVPFLLKWWNRLRDSEWLSDCEMRLDDEFTEWRRLSAGVRYALDMAADNLRVLHGLLKSDADAALPFVATYPLTRTALESASLAAWILAPNDPRERIDRHLRNAAREVYEESVLRKFSLKVASENRKGLGIKGSVIGREQKDYKTWYALHTEQICGCALDMGLPDPTLSARVGFAEIVGGANAATGTPAAYGELLWKQVSGLTHPSLMRATSTMNMSDASDNGDGTVHVVFSSKMSTLFSTGAMAVSLFRIALDLFDARTTRKGRRDTYADTSASQGA
jgi:hypothetical protein